MVPPLPRRETVVADLAVILVVTPAIRPAAEEVVAGSHPSLQTPSEVAVLAATIQTEAGEDRPLAEEILVVSPAEAAATSPRKEIVLVAILPAEAAASHPEVLAAPGARSTNGSRL